MSSLRRKEASRRNGALSQGPKTEAGKRRSSRNALRHGLLAKRVVLETDNEDNFHIVLDQYVERLEPADGVEYGMVEEMVGCYWRYHRAMAIEKQLFNEAIDKHVGTSMECLAAAWRDLADSKELQNLLRYQSMLHRMHRRAMNSFFEIRDIAFKAFSVAFRFPRSFEYLTIVHLPSLLVVCVVVETVRFGMDAIEGQACVFGDDSRM